MPIVTAPSVIFTRRRVAACGFRRQTAPQKVCILIGAVLEQSTTEARCFAQSYCASCCRVALASCVVAYFGLPYIQRLLAEWFSADVEVRAQLVMHTMEGPISRIGRAGQ